MKELDGMTNNLKNEKNVNTYLMLLSELKTANFLKLNEGSLLAVKRVYTPFARVVDDLDDRIDQTIVYSNLYHEALNVLEEKAYEFLVSEGFKNPKLVSTLSNEEQIMLIDSIYIIIKSVLSGEKILALDTKKYLNDNLVTEDSLGDKQLFLGLFAYIEKNDNKPDIFNLHFSGVLEQWGVSENNPNKLKRIRSLLVL